MMVSPDKKGSRVQDKNPNDKGKIPMSKLKCQI
jgi:hypothetical protein